MPNHKSTLRNCRIGFLMLMILIGTGFMQAFSPDFYSKNSKLSQGNWVKIEVSETGMQYISDATLRSLGFSDPEKVNVYGYGGVMIPENLNSPDDLPLVASHRVNGGILFFGKGSIGWERKTSGQANYTHVSHPYSDNSYYFLSDIDPERKTAAPREGISATGKTITEFTERVLHEQDLTPAMNTGRLMLGEDFKSAPTRTFKIELPGNTGNALMTTAFGCKTNSGTSSLMFTANGKQLSSTNSDQMAFSSSKLIVTTTTVKEIENPGTLLDLTIRFNGSGNVTKAALDYIEIEYPRSLTMTGGELYFYINPQSASEVKIEGTSDNTIVWDVTDALNALKIDSKQEGGTLSFVSESGYREYVAFDPEKITRGVTSAGKVANQDLHSLEAPGMLVICPAEYKSAALRLEELHRKTDGLTLAIVTPEEVYNEFSSGKPDVSAFRKFLKMWYDRAEGREGEYTGYCLIMSRPTYDNKHLTTVVKNAGYPRVPIWQSPTGETPTTSYSTDDYIGMLKDVTSSFNIGTAEINVAVGRMPLKSVNDANTALDKLEKYLLEPDYGAWRKNVMVIADDQDNGVHLDQAENVVEAFRSADKGNDYLIEKLYLDSYELVYTGTGPTYPQAKERMLGKWNEGTMFIDYIGHANPKSWGHESLLTWTDINSLSNSRLPFIYAATCEFLRWDDDDMSGAEILWLNPQGGVIGMICPSREVLISANGVLNRSTAKYVFARDENGQSLRVGEIMRKGKNDSNTGTNKLRYGLMGDPSMRLPMADLNVDITTINGVDIKGDSDLPVLAARSTAKVEGRITDTEGNPIPDFNGIVEIALFDAEKVITTNGNGSDGVESVYNDRKTRLYIGRAKVTDGEWNTSFVMPSEIENNYSPALLSLYAYDESGREANGSSEKLYAYGYDTTAPEDYEGPKILEFYINSPSFINGGEVSPNPTVTARFYDESGISVSEAGIGHSLTLELDGKIFYDDVAQYYVPDENDPGAGSFNYFLGQIDQGEHKLSFTVWDNANNSTTATLDFKVSALWKPTIETLATDVNPATTSVNFIVATDGAVSSMGCMIEVYDIWGRKVWGDNAPSINGSTSRTSLGWDLCDFGGSRIPAGIYLYKATVKTSSGATVTKTRKLMVK